jgi:hypothetical protein
MFFKRLNGKCQIYLVATAVFFNLLLLNHSHAATTRSKYFIHETVEDKYGVIAPWYKGLNGQCDFRVRVAAETLKRYPWVDTNESVAAGPHWLFTSSWNIDEKGQIGVSDPGDWMNGDSV